MLNHSQESVSLEARVRDGAEGIVRIKPFFHKSKQAKSELHGKYGRRLEFF